jgi:glycosyltransferase involved in cell wall biosynthesis
LAEASGAEGPVVHVFRNASNRLAYELQLFLPIGMRRYLKDSAADFDLLHIHGCHHLPGAMAARLAARRGQPFVVTTHGTAPRIERRRAAKWMFDHSFGRQLIPRAERIIAVSRAERRDLTGLGVEVERLVTIPNPLEEASAALPERGVFSRRYGLEGRLVMFLGKLTPRKRLDVLVRAFAQSRFHDATLVVVGNDLGGEQELWRTAARCGVAKRIRRIPLLKAVERLEALRDASVFVSPGEHEVFGLATMEAVVCGTPVIVASDSGCGELISEIGGGAAVAVGDAGAVARALDAMLSDVPRWREEAESAALRARERFAPEAVARLTSRTYAGLLERL